MPETATNSPSEQQAKAPERLTKRVCPDGFIDCGAHPRASLIEVEYIRADVAATSMRDRCVDMVRMMRNERAAQLRALANNDSNNPDAEHERAVLFVLANVIDGLQSLTLDNQQPAASCCISALLHSGQKADRGRE